MARIKLDSGDYATLDDIPNICPYCHKSINPDYITFNFSATQLEIIFKCPNHSCNKSFNGYYNHNYGEYYLYRGMSIGNIEKIEFSEHIESLSPSFVTIYNQAHFSESHELFEICGVGYRKALEFLIKDYLITKFPDREPEIKEKFLGRCISEDVEDTKIKKVAKRAVWLGNDETHYVRKWEGKNLEDLKKLITLTIHWIEMEYLTEIVETEMPE